MFHSSITPYNGPVAEVDIANMHTPPPFLPAIYTHTDALIHTLYMRKTNKTCSAVSLIVQYGLANVQCFDHGPQVKMVLMKYFKLFSVLLQITLCFSKEINVTV